MAVDPAKYRRRDYLPFARHFFGDVISFRRQGWGWRLSIVSALDYWRFDRSIGL